MRKVWNVLALSAFVSPLGIAAQEGAPPATEHSQHEQHTAPAVGTEQEEASMASMHEHMLKMQEQMARIHDAKDPTERERLMSEQMQNMQQQMKSMQERMQMMGSMCGRRQQ
jgi:hypothetical protein